MSICPNSKVACECQPQDGVMCPHGPTPPFQPWSPEPVRDAHGCIVLHNGREVVYRDDVLYGNCTYWCPACYAEVGKPEHKADLPKPTDLPAGEPVNRERAALKAMEYADEKVAHLYPGKKGTPEANSAWARFYKLEYNALVSGEPWRLT